MRGQVAPCPECEKEVRVPPAPKATTTPERTKTTRQAAVAPTPQAFRKRKVEMAGTGAAVQLLGVVLLFVWPIGTAVGIALLIAGSSMAVKWVCSACGNRIEKGARICPACQAELAK